ncbi:C-X-C chemokine receptor type 2-like [Coregonus clupeaformis]|uniref:C-X-C chemokine receptor type 2-like n=1 Tax=Coregonus clupeaformis TaxID=59861 RepID=UPI001E1C6D5E|nr:C-X-C chemokine receptor type 2-like [Coregonus clupeaformis]
MTELKDSYVQDYYYDSPNDSYYINITSFVLNSNTLSCAAQPLYTSAVISLCVLHIAIFLLAVPGNLLVGLVIGSSQQSLTPSDVYLFHLTVADGLLALTLPFWAAAMLHGWIFGDFLCKFLSLVTEASFYTSILFLVCISVDRYLVIVRSAKSRKDRRRACSWVACTFIWALGGVLSLPALFNDAFTPPGGGPTKCAERFDLGSATHWRLATRGLRHIIGFLLPLVIMVACYSVTVARLLRTRGFQKHRAMRVIVAVVIAFLLCWTPFHLTVMADTLMRAKLVPFDCADRNRVDLALQVTHSLALLHSCVNPVLYAFVGEKFRRNLGALVRKSRGPERGSVSRYSRSTSQTSEGNGLL